QNGSPGAHIQLQELMQFGAPEAVPDSDNPSGFSWMWRSSIQYYDLHSRIWSKWLSLAIKRWFEWTPRISGDRSHKERFREYDEHVASGSGYSAYRSQAYNRFLGL